MNEKISQIHEPPVPHRDTGLDLSQNQSRGVEDLCARCSTIAWQGLTDRDLFHPLLIFIHETVEAWDISRCRLCRLLAKSLPIEYPPDMTPWLCWNASPPDGIAGESLGTLRFQGWEDDTLDRRSRPHEVDVYDGVDSATAYVFRTRLEPRANFDLIKTWITDCKATHTLCEPTTRDSLVNFRVIDCEQRAVVQAPADCDYVALSYVWGQNFVAEPAARGSQFDQLPRTLEDSIAVAQLLGYRYLWIDRLVWTVSPTQELC